MDLFEKTQSGNDGGSQSCQPGCRSALDRVPMQYNRSLGSWSPLVGVHGGLGRGFNRNLACRGCCQDVTPPPESCPDRGKVSRWDGYQGDCMIGEEENRLMDKCDLRQS